MTFDPNNCSPQNQGIFGLPFSEEESDLVLIPVPWEATTSYGSGCSLGPQSILKASPQLDLYDLKWGNFYKKGIHLQEIKAEILDKNERAESWAQKVIESLDAPSSNNDTAQLIAQVNQASNQINDWVYNESQKLLNKNKKIGLIGGDHSCPLGLIKSLTEQHGGDFGILHIDAHADLRDAYQGFTHSHASIMRNVMELDTPPKKLVSVGIRDFCEEEFSFAESSPAIKTFYDQEIQEQLFNNFSWNNICQAIIKELPDKVYVSFDIDGLSPEFCPHTGTPVPGGLHYSQALFLLNELKNKNKQVIGFDLCEVAPNSDNPHDEWDGNVGARLLYKLCGLMLS